MLVTHHILITAVFVLLFSFLSLFGAAANRLGEAKLTGEAEGGDKKSRRLLTFLRDEKGESKTLFGLRWVSALFAALSIVNVFYACPRYFCGAIGRGGGSVISPLAALVVVGLTALLLYLFGEVLAKIIALKWGESVARAPVAACLALVTIFRPVHALLNWIWRGAAKLFRADIEREDEVTEEEIMHMVAEAAEDGTLDSGQSQIIERIFEFDDISAGDVMNHRTEIVAVMQSEGLDSVLKTAIDAGFSRIPVYEEDLDNIIGVVYAKDLLKFAGKKLPERATLKNIMREVFHIPQSKRCLELFREMREKRVQMAIVVDEYGGTAGIVTLEDLIESILGNIQDEYDDEPAEIKKVDEDTFTIDGQCEIEEAGEMLGVDLPEGDYDTVGGFILSRLGYIPAEYEQPSVEEVGFKFTVISSCDRKIETVKAEKLRRDAAINN